jgi:hypothetical protein
VSGERIVTVTQHLVSKKDIRCKLTSTWGLAAEESDCGLKRCASHYREFGFERFNTHVPQTMRISSQVALAQNAAQNACPRTHLPKIQASRTSSRIPLRLPSSVPSINPQITAGHKAARITDAEHCSTSVLLRHAELSKHVLRGPVTPALGVFLEQSFDHGRRDVAWRDGVDTNAVGAPFRGKVAAEL